MEIIPVASCEKVIENTKGLNGKHHIFRRNVFGVIDNDYRSLDEIKSLNEHKICVLPYNEWENLLLDSDILKALNNDLFQKEYQTIEANLIIAIKERKTSIMTAYINKRYQRILSANKFHYSEELSNEIDSINRSNKELIMNELTEFSQKFDRFVSNKNYENLGSVTFSMGYIN